MFDENGKRLSDAESDAHAEFNGLMDNYVTIYLPKKYDDMVNVNNKFTTPPNVIPREGISISRSIP